MKRFLLLLTIIFGILFLRFSQPIMQPELYEEDGNIFFKDQYELGFVKAFTRHRVEVYTHSVERIVAGVASWFPLEWTAHIYVWSSVLFTCLSFALFSLPWFRHIISNDNIRFVICILFCFMPNSEALFKLCYLEWYALFMLCLLLVAEFPKKNILTIPMAVLAWSNPATPLLIPFMMFMLWKDKGFRNYWAWIIIFTGMYYHNITKDTGAMNYFWHNILAWINSCFHVITLRLIDYLFYGYKLSASIQNWPNAIYESLLVGIPLLILIAMQRRNLAMWKLIYILLAVASAYVMRPYEWGQVSGWDYLTWHTNGRHFYVSLLLLLIVCGILYEKYFHSGSNTVFIVLLCWLCLHCRTFHEYTCYYRVSWHENVKLISNAERGSTVHVVMSPVDRSFELKVR